MREPSGAHRHGEPPLVGPERGSDPPVTSRGASWKAIVSVLSILAGLAGSIGTYLYTHAEESVERRAFEREVRAQLDRIEDNGRIAAARIARHDEELATDNTQIAILRRDVDVHDRELEEIKRRVFRRREAP